MNILLSVHEGLLKEKYFPKNIIEQLEKLGYVKQNMLDRPWTEEELTDEIKDMDMCITHWQSPQITPNVLKNAGSLKFIGHCAGSVFNIICPEVYENGIKVSSVNKIMARSVAEGTLAYILASRLKLAKYTAITKNGGWKKKISDYGDMKTLYNANVLLIGFGDIAKFLYELLSPFNVMLNVYDPYIKKDTRDLYPSVNFTANLEGAIKTADIISIHASRNPKTDHLIDRARIDMIKNEALLVNTARGSIVDEAYLTEVLKTGRIYGALDVYKNEPLDPGSELRHMPNVICMPHMAGSSVVSGYAKAIINDMKNFIDGQPLEYEISAEKANMMTR